MASAPISIKISSFNALIHRYSEGYTSFRDQLAGARAMLEAENPDVGVLLEMPNPHAIITTTNLLLSEAIANFDQWLVEHKYFYTKRMQDDLAVWVVSRLPLIPLLLLSNSTLGGAIGAVSSTTGGGGFGGVNAQSTLPECMQEMGSPDRSIIVGVVAGPQLVLPLIATHAKCRYYNQYFGDVLLFFCRMFARSKGMIIGDMNIDLASAKGSAKDPTPLLQTLQANLHPSSFTKLQNLIQNGGLGAVSYPVSETGKQLPTATAVSFPYEPLCIDGVIAPSWVGVRVSNHRGPIPSETHPSDHQWISVTAPEEWMIRCPPDSRSVISAWTATHQPLVDIMKGGRLRFEVQPGGSGVGGAVSPPQRRSPPPNYGTPTAEPPAFLALASEVQNYSTTMEQRNETQPFDEEDDASDPSEGGAAGTVSPPKVQAKPRPPNCPDNKYGLCQRGVDCPLAHTPCKSGNDCYNPLCSFGHPLGWIAKEKKK